MIDRFLEQVPRLVLMAAGRSRCDVVQREREVASMRRGWSLSGTVPCRVDLLLRDCYLMCMQENGRWCQDVALSLRLEEEEKEKVEEALLWVHRGI